MKRVTLFIMGLMVSQIALGQTQTLNEIEEKPTEKPRQICVREKPVGSKLPIRVCRNAQDSEKEGQAARDSLQNAQTQRFDPPQPN